MTDKDQPVDADIAPSRDMELAIDPRSVLRTLLVVIAILVILSTAGQAMVHNLPDFFLRNGIANFLSVAREQSLPTLYSTAMLLAAGILTGVIAHVHRRAGGDYVSHWTALAFVLMLLSVDEFASLHDQASEPIRGLLRLERGPLYYSWVVLGAAVVAVFGVVFLPFLRHLPSATRRGFWIAAGLFLGGAIGVELVNSWWASSYGEFNLGYVAITTVEEALEMLGVAVLVYALLAYIPVGLPNARWSLRVAAGNSAKERGAYPTSQGD